VSASKRYWTEDIVEPEIEVTSRGTIAIRNSPGTGYVPKKDLIEKLTLRKEVIRSRAAAV
jgi:O-succinylbenzoate synthase